jgi:hypothetical protein
MKDPSSNSALGVNGTRSRHPMDPIISWELKFVKDLYSISFCSLIYRQSEELGERRGGNSSRTVYGLEAKA